MTSPSNTEDVAKPIICTPESPWSPEMGTPVRHTNAREIGEQEDGYPSGDLVHMRCADCGAEWKKELPQ